MTTTSNDALWSRWRSDQDTDAHQELLARYLGLVHHAAHEVAPRVRSAVSLDELISAGSLGLMQAMNGFQPERGLAFSTFAMRRIRGAILDELRARDPLTRTERVHARRLEQAVTACEQRLGRTPTTSELADHLGVDHRTIHRWREETRTTTGPSLQESIGDRRMAEQFGDGDLDAHTALELKERGGVIHAALDTLPARERLILRRSYLEEQSLATIARELGITESRVCQLRAQAIRRLRQSPMMELAVE